MAGTTTLKQSVITAAKWCTLSRPRIQIAEAAVLKLEQRIKLKR